MTGALHCHDVMFAAALFSALLSQAVGGPLRLGASISGRVSDKQSGQPLPRMVVTLVGADSRDQTEQLTDADGRYRFDNVVPGKYAISAGNDDHRAAYLKEWFGDGEPAQPFGSSHRLNVTVTAVEPPTSIDIALTRALAIEGHVFDPWETPVANAGISAARADGRATQAHSSPSDDLGAYRIYGLRPGRYRVCAAAGGRLGVLTAVDGLTAVKTCYPGTISETNAADVTLTSHDVFNIDIRVQRIPSLSISGTVTDEAGAPIDGAHVDVAGFADPAPSSAVTHSGAFVVDGLIPGRYLVRASLGDRRPGRAGPGVGNAQMAYAIADLTAGASADIAMIVSEPRTVRGTVVSDGATPPRTEPSRIVVHTQPGQPGPGFFEQYPSAVVADDLTFELSGVYGLPMLVAAGNLPEGWALRYVRYGGRDVTFVPTHFDAGPASKLEVMITNRVARPQIRVIDEHGDPVQDARVIRLAAADTRRQSELPALLDPPSSEGIVKMDALAPGDYLFAALSL